MSEFVRTSPTLDAYWRAVILFGGNVASYKFALAKSLLEIADQEKTFVSLEELSEPFSRHISEHLKKADRQGTFATSRFLDACRSFNEGKIAHEQLLEQTTRLGFNNVIDAFHIVSREEIPKRFFIDDRESRKGITITDELFSLKEIFQYQNLPFEVEARWRLVETAWSLNISPTILTVSYDPLVENLFVRTGRERRVGITSCRDALNGYQKGKCFYCSTEVSIKGEGENRAEVDHFFPHILKQSGQVGDLNLDGVWNLVLSCVECNRGPGGKHSQVPEIIYLESLSRRNNYLIESHHPLRETLRSQTGKSEIERRMFLQEMDKVAIRNLIHRWKPPN
jgi:hypothetical protein